MPIIRPHKAGALYVLSSLSLSLFIYRASSKVRLYTALQRYRSTISKSSMAKASSNNAFIFFLSIVAISLLLTVAMAKDDGSRLSSRAGPQCDTVHGVKSGDICFDVAKASNLTLAFFDALNPNLNCTTLFIGQWLCIKGSP
ncbi:hypothetical protein BT93_E2436 [Corymbia citriodora subsp. variegata]|nr:hypothetical protein BT93_E2436 [Corymbia citriodora subsp. variegata]